MVDVFDPAFEKKLVYVLRCRTSGCRMQGDWSGFLEGQSPSFLQLVSRAERHQTKLVKYMRPLSTSAYLPIGLYLITRRSSIFQDTKSIMLQKTTYYSECFVMSELGTVERGLPEVTLTDKLEELILGADRRIIPRIRASCSRRLSRLGHFEHLLQEKSS